MIVDRIENAGLYKNISPELAKAFELLKNPAVLKKEVGKYEVEGDKLYYSVLKYSTKPLAEGKFEVHRKYIDVQYIIKGTELIACTDVARLKTAKPYDEASDVAFYDVTGEFNSVSMSAGWFCVFWPNDAHLPCRTLETESDVHKIVVKIKVESR